MNSSPEQDTAERLSVTLKAAAGYEAPWIVVRGSTVDDVADELNKLDMDETLLRAAATVAAAFQKIYLEAKGQPQQAQQAQPQNLQQSIPQQSSSPPEWAQQPAQAQVGQFCEQCGQPLEFKSGTKNGRSWQGWFCQTKGHKVVWA